MYHEFSDILARMGLWETSGTVLLAVSGGIDSMCMADLFRRTGLPFAIAHCNFHLRGAESDGDEAMVRDWAARAGIRFHKTDFDTETFAADNGTSIEMAARELRYKWFSRLCVEEGYSALCVAHNANDNAETLFLNLVRGTGLKGLSGMGEESFVPYSEEGVRVRLLRPLLSFARKQIEGYVRRYSIPYREDRTNAETDYRRNRIRHLVFPVLEQMNPSFIRTVSEEMTYFSQAGAIADIYYRSVADAVVKESGPGAEIDLARLKSYGQWEYVLYRFLENHGFNGAAVSSVVSLLKSDRTVSGKMFRSAGFVLVTAGGKLILRPASSFRTENREGARGFRNSGLGRPGALFPSDTGDDSFTVVRGEGSYRCNGSGFRVSVVPRSGIGTLRQPAGTLIFDAASLKFPFVCRIWRDGDWFVPFGMKGRKKVSDFFTDLKYDLFRKKASVMVVDTADTGRDEHRIAAVLGERIDDRYRVSDSTSEVLSITLLPETEII